MVDLIKSPLCYCATLKWIIHFVPVNKVRLLLTGGGQRLFEVRSGGGTGYMELDKRGGNAYLKPKMKTPD